MRWFEFLRIRARAMRIPCAIVVERLWEYLDEELDDPKVRARIEAHLEVCARCFPEYAYRRAFLSLLENHAASPIPPGLRVTVFQQLLAVDAAELP